MTEVKQLAGPLVPSTKRIRFGCFNQRFLDGVGIKIRPFRVNDSPVREDISRKGSHDWFFGCVNVS